MKLLDIHKFDKFPKYQDVDTGDYSVEQHKGINYYAVSHRWESHGHPDPTDSQINEIKSIIPKGTLIFYDYSSLPQNPRTSEEESIFKRDLSDIDEIYRNKKVVILNSGSVDYHTRGWCFFEWFISVGNQIGNTSLFPELVDVRALDLLLSESKNVMETHNITKVKVLVKDVRVNSVIDSILDRFEFRIKSMSDDFLMELICDNHFRKVVLSDNDYTMKEIKKFIKEVINYDDVNQVVKEIRVTIKRLKAIDVLSLLKQHKSKAKIFKIEERLFDAWVYVGVSHRDKSPITMDVKKGTHSRTEMILHLKELIRVKIEAHESNLNERVRHILGNHVSNKSQLIRKLRNKIREIEIDDYHTELLMNLKQYVKVQNLRMLRFLTCLNVTSGKDMSFLIDKFSAIFSLSDHDIKVSLRNSLRGGTLTQNTKGCQTVLTLMN